MSIIHLLLWMDYFVYKYLSVVDLTDLVHFLAKVCTGATFEVKLSHHFSAIDGHNMPVRGCGLWRLSWCWRADRRGRGNRFRWGGKQYRRYSRSELGWKRGCRGVLLHLCAATVKDDFPCLPLYYWDGGSSGMIHGPAWKSMWASQTWNRCGRLARQKWELKRGRRRGLWREGGGAEEFTEVHKSRLLSSWAGPHGGVGVRVMWEGKKGGEVSWCGNGEVLQRVWPIGGLKAYNNG